LVAGRRRAARDLLARTELAELDSRARAHLLAALAADCEREGREREALRLYERAASCGAGFFAHVCALLLALREHEFESVEWSLDRMRSVPATAARSARALGDLERKRELVGLPMSPTERQFVECRLTEQATQTLPGGAA